MDAQFRSLEEQFLKATALELNLTGDPQAAFLARFNPKNADRENSTLASSIVWNKDLLHTSQKLQAELTNICKILEDHGCPFNKPDEQKKPGRAPKGQSPWEQGYKWLWESRFPEWQRENNQQLSVPAEVCSNGQASIDALVQQVRSRLLPFITAPHSIIGTMRMFSVSQPVPVDKIYIDLNVLEQVSSLRHFSNWRGEYEPGNRQDFDRLSLSQVKQKGVEAISVIKNYAKLLVLGKPGAGKTTFLKSLAVKCIQPEEEFFADLVPLFVALPEFAKMVHKTKTSWNLFDYLASELAKQLNGCDANTKEILVQGRALVLLDGLDEVPPEDIENVIDAVRDFGYRNNRLVITCRTQSQKELEGFTDVEVADFTPKQVARFVENWFNIVDSGTQASLAPQLQQQLRAIENKTIAELTVTPVLLNLICAVFRDEQGNLPKKRFQLYEKGIRQLLERLKRMPIDQKLTIDIKEDFLAALAVMLFEKNDYFPEEQTLEKFIGNYFGVERSTARNIMKIFETETGLLIERSAGYWSFSHLTFQEYLVAKWFCDRADCQGLANHITEKPWWEVFLLVTGMMELADDLVQLMKQNIDFLLVKHNKVQKFLAWVNHKTCSVKNTYNPAKRLPRVHFREDCQDIECKKAAIRAFYYELALAPNHNHNLAVSLYRNLISKFSNNFGLHGEPEHRLSSEFELCGVIEHGLAPYLHFASDLAIVGADDLAIDAALDSNLDYVCGRIDKLELLELIKEISELKNQIPPKAQGINIFEEWWKLNGKNWTEQLRSIIVKFRNIGHNWDLEPEEIELLKKYYNANKLLVDCLNSGCSVNNEVREAIEDTLLLPIAEIEKRKQAKAE